ncbi:Hemoglobin subunit beta [Frankliniella fusca]|uniref:Hemoglobin subunit beta n=1 Tax=Frankliniella fusca TaxID=407009 RepID=A0AAE1LU73_9NEOP|nr:Hemoglobin subunit beta [Frankliniella fusca]
MNSCDPVTNRNSAFQLQSSIRISAAKSGVTLNNFSCKEISATVPNATPPCSSKESECEIKEDDLPLPLVKSKVSAITSNETLDSSFPTPTRTKTARAEPNVSAAKSGVTLNNFSCKEISTAVPYTTSPCCSKECQCEIKDYESSLPLVKSKASRRRLSKPNYVQSSSDDGDFYGDSSDNYTPTEKDSESEVIADSEASDTIECMTKMKSSTTTEAKERETVMEPDLSADLEDSDSTEFKKKSKSSTSTEAIQRKRVKEHGLGNKSSVAKSCKEQEPSSASGTVKVQKIHKTRIVNNRDWSKQYACYYCGIVRSKLMEHYESQHAEEKEVVNILALPVNSKERHAAIGKLRAAGALKHNEKVNSLGKGVLQVKRRCKRSGSPKEYQTCPYCGESMKLVSRHKKKCALKPSVGSKKTSGTRIMSSIPNEFHKGVFLNVVLRESRSKDEIFHLVKNDELLVEFGASLVEHHSNKPQQYNNIRNKLRNCGRFLRAIKSLGPSIKCLEDAITPMKFDLCIQATQQVAGFDLSTNTFKIPSVAKRIGDLLEAIAVILQKRAIKTQNEAKQKCIRDFITLREMDWSSKVSSKASLQLKELRYNKPVPLPDKDDTIKLADYLETHTEKAMKSLEDTQTSKHFNDLTQVTLARILVFNRKRPGDVHNLTVETYICKKEKSRKLTSQSGRVLIQRSKPL